MRCALLDSDHAGLLEASRLVEAQGHDCHGFTEVWAFQEAFLRDTYDAALLAWPLARHLDLLGWLREDHGIRIPLLVISDHAQEAQVVLALQAGADGYLTRPLRPREFGARLQALLRGQYQYQADAEQALGPWVLNAEQRTVSYCGNAIALTACETVLVKLFFSNVGRVLSHVHITDELRRNGTGITLRSLRTHISRLRLKLNLCDATGLRLAAISKAGYRLEPTGCAAHPLGAGGLR
jgi:DNA-binding response OmpR family regulator